MGAGGGRRGLVLGSHAVSLRGVGRKGAGEGLWPAPVPRVWDPGTVGQLLLQRKRAPGPPSGDGDRGLLVGDTPVCLEGAPGNSCSCPRTPASLRDRLSPGGRWGSAEGAPQAPPSPLHPQSPPDPPPLSRRTGPGAGAGGNWAHVALTFWSRPSEAWSVPPPVQGRFPTGAAGVGPVGEGGLEWCAGRREQAGGVCVRGAPAAAPARLPFWSALGPRSPGRGERVPRAALTSSPAGAPGGEGAALALGVPLRSGVGRALQERKRSGSKLQLLSRGGGRGPPAVPPTSPGRAARPWVAPPPKLEAQTSPRPAPDQQLSGTSGPWGWEAPPPGLGLLCRPHRKWRRYSRCW